MRKLPCLVLTAFVAGASPALAHYNMLLPSASSGKKGEAVTFTYQWGHPFEHQLFDAPKPESVSVCAPDGNSQDLTKMLEKVSLSAGEGKTVTGYRFTFTPGQRGDYVFVLKAPPIWMEEDGGFLQDIVKVVYHVQAQKGWDGPADRDFEWVPLTRPYGLEPGLVFQAKIRSARGMPLSGATVEVENYNATPPKNLPPDEQITRVYKTDPNGVVTCSLTGAGWWAITALRDGGVAQHDGKEVPLRQRSTLWVFVEEKAK
jgi:cobalt/nickel transport protein